MEKTSEQGKKKRGWWGIGLVVVICVIIAAIAIPRLGGGTKKKVTQAFADMKSIADALEIYHTDKYVYPAALADLTTELTTDLTTTYMSSIPDDPFGDSNDERAGKYGYYVNTDNTACLLVSNGPDGKVDVTLTADAYGWYSTVAGQLGGTDGALEGYGATWSDGKSKSSAGDLGMGGGI